MPPVPDSKPTFQSMVLHRKQNSNTPMCTDRFGEASDRTAVVSNASTSPAVISENEILPKGPSVRTTPASILGTARAPGRRITLPLISQSEAMPHAGLDFGSVINCIDFGPTAIAEELKAGGCVDPVPKHISNEAHGEIAAGNTVTAHNRRPSMIPVRKSRIADISVSPDQTVLGLTPSANRQVAVKDNVATTTTSKRFTTPYNVPGGRHTAMRAFLRRLSLPAAIHLQQAYQTATKKLAGPETRLRAQKVADLKTAGSHSILFMSDQEINNHPDIIKDRQLLYAPDAPLPYYVLPDIMDVKPFDDWYVSPVLICGLVFY
jgi:hypothetical protein